MATPFLVQRTDYPVFQSGSAITDLFGSGKIKFKLPNPSPGGNLLVVGFSWGDQTTTWACADDQGNTYTATAAFATLNGDTMQFFYVPNCAANTQVITLTPTPATLPNHTAGFVAEFGNAATATPIDIGQQTGGATGTSVTTAALVTTVDADLIVQYAINESAVSTTSIAAGTSPWKLGGADIMNAADSHFWQWQVQAAHGSITPTMTVAPSCAWSSIAISFKSASAGNGLSAGIKVTDSQGNANDNATGRTSPFTIQFPCPAGTNLLIGVWVGASGDLTAVSDSINGAWTSARASSVNGASGTVHIWYKAGASGGPNMTVTCTTAAATSLGDTFDILAAQGAAASPLDLTNEANGIQGAAGSLNIVSITPTTSNGLVVACVGVQSNNCDPASWSPGYWDPPDENNAWGHYYNPNTSAIQFSVTTNHGAVSNWESQAAAFKAAPAGTTVSVDDTDLLAQRFVSSTRMESQHQQELSETFAILPQRPPFAFEDDGQNMRWSDWRALLHEDPETQRALPPIPPFAIQEEHTEQKWTDWRVPQHEDPETQRALPPIPPFSIQEEFTEQLNVDWKARQYEDTDTHRSLPPTPPFAIQDEHQDEKNFSWSAIQYDDSETQRALPPVPPSAIQNEGEDQRWAGYQVIFDDGQESSKTPIVIVAPNIGLDDIEAHIEAYDRVALYHEDDLSTPAPLPPLFAQDDEQHTWRGWLSPAIEDDWRALPPLPPFAPPDDTGEKWTATSALTIEDDQAALPPLPPLPPASIQDDEQHAWRGWLSPAIEDDWTALPPVPPFVPPDDTSEKWTAMSAPAIEDDWTTSAPIPPLAFEDDLKTISSSAIFFQIIDSDFTGTPPVPPVILFGSDDQSLQGYAAAGLSGLIMLDDFVNAPLGPILGPPTIAARTAAIRSAIEAQSAATRPSIDALGGTVRPS
jgi:hypothetical protein